MEDDVQDRWDTFLSKHDEAVDKHVPVETSSGGGLRKSKWMNKKALQAINKKAEAWKFHRKKRTNKSYEDYCLVLNNAVDAVREAKLRYEKSVAAEVKSGDTAVFYSYARSRTTVKEEVTRMLLSD